MLSELPVNWDGDVVDLPHDVVPQAACLAAFEPILAQAMRATECANAIICRIIEGELISLTGSEPALLRDELSLWIDEVATRCIVQVKDERPVVSEFQGDLCGNARFTAGVPIPGVEGAMLIVFNSEPRSHLSGAQMYVLRSHAAHLKTVLELAELRERVSPTDDRNNQASLERLRLLESVAVHARDSIVITEAEPIDLPGPRIIYCNAAFTRATGYSPAEVLGSTPRILQGPKTDPLARAMLRRALAAWEPIEIEMINYRKDGTEFWVELSIVPVANEQGWFTHWVSVQRDITERKNAEELTARVRNAELENQELATEILERKRIEAELQYAAFHDSLTRLRNRAFFMERLGKALKGKFPHESATCSVLFLDLDRFKIVNDSLGHLEGDALLKEVAQRLKRCVRTQDTLARIGGDEFAILIEDAPDLSIPISIAEGIIEALRTPIQLGRQGVFPSCSIGIVQASSANAVPDDLMRDADIAMYEAKRAGFGDYAIFDTLMRENATGRLVLQTDLRRAVERDEFLLVFQPVVDPASGAVRSLKRSCDGSIRPAA